MAPTLPQAEWSARQTDAEALVRDRGAEGPVGEAHAVDPADSALGLSGSSWPALFDCIANGVCTSMGAFRI